MNMNDFKKMKHLCDREISEEFSAPVQASEYLSEDGKMVYQVIPQKQIYRGVEKGYSQGHWPKTWEKFC